MRKIQLDSETLLSELNTSLEECDLGGIAGLASVALYRFGGSRWTTTLVVVAGAIGGQLLVADF